MCKGIQHPGKYPVNHAFLEPVHPGFANLEDELEVLRPSLAHRAISVNGLLPFKFFSAIFPESYTYAFLLIYQGAI